MGSYRRKGRSGGILGRDVEIEREVTAPATDAAKQWDGWGTALKPAVEDWWLCRKPLEGTVAGNVQEWGTGALNVAATRVSPTCPDSVALSFAGRWPPHLLLSHAPGCTCLFTDDDAPANGEDWKCVDGCPVLEVGRQSGESVSKVRERGGTSPNPMSWNKPRADGEAMAGHSDHGTAARFFPQFRYSAKPSRAERDAGIRGPRKTAGKMTGGRAEGSPGLDCPRSGAGRRSGARNHHPTVKSLDLMRWLCRLITPPGGVVLDPFMGSGSTGCAALLEEFNFVGIEQDPEYLEMARDRLHHWAPMWASEVA